MLCAGLQDLTIKMANQEAHVLLARAWGGLAQLTTLIFIGMDSFRQQGGPAGGAMASLFRHLHHLMIQVAP
jgi:hypothetical protein